MCPGAQILVELTVCYVKSDLGWKGWLHLSRSICTILLFSKLFRKLTQKHHFFSGSTYLNHNLKCLWEEDSVLFILCWRDQGINWLNGVNHAEEAYANELLKNQCLERSQMKNSPIMPQNQSHRTQTENQRKSPFLYPGLFLLQPFPKKVAK